MAERQPALTRDLDVLRGWIGQSETSTDLINARRVRLMQATLDQTPSARDGDPVPPMWHYLYFNPEVRASDLKADGHEALGRFLPPVDLPRRMWAGGRVEIHRPLVIGETATKTSTIRGIEGKDGRSGPLCFVTVEHRIEVDGTPCFSEVQNIVYRDMPRPGSVASAAPPETVTPEAIRKITPDPVMLFRFSALIFYSHRIHYDADYTRDVEGYPGLVVHGPLVAGLLANFGLEHARRRRLIAFDIRAHSPLFAPDPFFLVIRQTPDGLETWARTSKGTRAMTVRLQFAGP